jgi:ABC-type sugar transport system substrate-binding protein
MKPTLFILWSVLMALSGLLAAAIAAWKIGPAVVKELADNFVGGMLKGWKHG